MTLSGALLIDKKPGVTSYDVIRDLKRRFRFQKIGHAGTLDPFATGLLVVLLGEATRLQAVVMSGRKRYEGEIALGAGTATDDCTGDVVERDMERRYREASQEELIARLHQRFTGKILQRPPAVSAIKQQGKRSYDLVREGIQPELQEREIEIFALELHFTLPDTLFYRVECSKGTYVRSLGRDIGRYLETCAAVSSLRRTRSGSFSVADAIEQDALGRMALDELPIVEMSALVQDLPALRLSMTEIEALRRGNQRVLSNYRPEVAEEHALFSEEGKYCGLLDAFLAESDRLEFRIRYLSAWGSATAGSSVAPPS